MSARLTVVLDDEELYRRAKIRAAETGLSLKAIVEQALRSYLGRERREPPRFTREMWEEWQAESRMIDDEILQRERRLAEEGTNYDA